MRMIYVIGMHRSGTSATTRVLNLLGASLGDESKLMEPQPDNPTGFWEPRAVAKLNDEILALLGGTWDEPPDPQRGWAARPEFEDFRTRATQLLADLRSDGAEVHALKDPRLSITLPLWLEADDLENRVVLPIRKPQGVARSLLTRNGIPLARGAELWLAYVRSAVRTVDRPLVIDYADLLGSTAHVTRRLAEEIRLWPVSDEAWDGIRSFLQPDLDHDRGTHSDSTAMAEAMKLYARLRSGDLAAVRRA